MPECISRNDFSFAVRKRPVQTYIILGFKVIVFQYNRQQLILYHFEGSGTDICVLPTIKDDLVVDDKADTFFVFGFEVDIAGYRRFDVSPPAGRPCSVPFFIGPVEIYLFGMVKQSRADKLRIEIENCNEAPAISLPTGGGRHLSALVVTGIVKGHSGFRKDIIFQAHHK